MEFPIVHRQCVHEVLLVHRRIQRTLAVSRLVDKEINLFFNKISLKLNPGI
jgi:hypothetical protein